MKGIPTGKQRKEYQSLAVSKGEATDHMQQINPKAAGIDIGSTKHYVAVPAGLDKEPVRNFGCFTPDLHQMARWLRRCGIETVAMESTGVYWVPVYEVLERYGLDVKLVDARHVKNVPGRKTDVLDCQWIQQLHSFGLLFGAFIPEEGMGVLRSYWRQRAALVESCSKQIHLMHKALEQMNLQLHKVLSDVTGVTGMKIIRAIIAGEHDPVILACMRNSQVKSSEETIAKALTGEYREEHLFALKQALELYDVYQEKIAECDRQIEQHMQTFEAKGNPEQIDSNPGDKRKRRKNEPFFDLGAQLCRITGVNLTRIDGIDVTTAQTIITECGIDMSQFPTEKHFASWLGLCPNNRVTGGKVKRTKTKKVSNRAAQALRLAAHSLHSSKSALGAYYRRMRQRLGAPKAITATAHKLACRIYRVLKFGEEYVDEGQERYEQHYQARVLKNLKSRAQSMGFTLVSIQTGETVS